MNYWGVLGIDPTNDKRTIKKAYAKKLKRCRPEEDAAGYQRLREAYDAALIDVDNGISDAGCKSEAALVPVEKNVVNRGSESEADTTSSADASDSDAVTEDPWALAQKAHHWVFDADSAEQGQARFEEVLQGDQLLNLRARENFERLCLDSVCEICESPAIPLEFCKTVVKHFRWLSEHRPDEQQRHKIGYIESRLTVAWQLEQSIAKPCRGEAGDFLDRWAARIITTDYQPRRFAGIRFLALCNARLAAITTGFSLSVQRGLCPELQTDTFNWWQKSGERIWWTASHLILGCMIAAIVVYGLADDLPHVFPAGGSGTWEKFAKFLGLAFGASLMIWGVQWGWHKGRRWHLEVWERLRQAKGVRFWMLAAASQFALLADLFSGSAASRYMIYGVIWLVVWGEGWRNFLLIGLVSWISFEIIRSGAETFYSAYPIFTGFLASVVVFKLYARGVSHLPRRVRDSMNGNFYLMCIPYIAVIAMYLFLLIKVSQ